MKMLFLEIDSETTWGLASVGPGYIGAYTRLHGHETALLWVQPDQQVQDIICSIERHAPDILGFSLTTRQWQRAAYIAGQIRKSLNIPVIAGGLHPTFAPESVVKSQGFDYVCLGEGEGAVCDLLLCLEKDEEISAGRIANIWVKGTNRPEIRPPFEPLDRMPFIARDLLDEKHGVIHVSTQRGCSFHYPGTRLFDLCSQKRYLPENWLELPAKSRQSILNLPDLTKDDIEYYYNRFSEVRERIYMNRYGSAINEEGKALVSKGFAESPAVG